MHGSSARPLVDDVAWFSANAFARDPLAQSLAFWLGLNRPTAEGPVTEGPTTEGQALPAVELQLVQTDLLVADVDGVVCAALRYPDSSLYPNFDPRAFAAGLKTLLKGLAQMRKPVEVIMFGGDAQAWRDLNSARPRFSWSAMSLYQWQAHDAHVDKRARLKHPAYDLLRYLQSQRDAGETALLKLGFKNFSLAVEQARQRYSEVRDESQAFREQYRLRRPWLTWSLAVFIGAVFVLQSLWGGAEKTPVLWRMGAMSAAGIAQGQWWRLWSASFLHGGVMHVAFNLYVLVILGAFFERVFGPWRLALLYVAAVGAGGLGSWLYLLNSDASVGLSVGASGGLWGLLTAHAILAFRYKHLLPRSLHSGAQKAALINLGINVLNSFQPHVDFAAHLGGGLMGGLLMLSGALIIGVKPLGRERAEAADDSGAAVKFSSGHDDKNAASPTPLLLRAVALLAGVLLLSSLALAWQDAKPWQLTAAPDYDDQMVQIGSQRYALKIPAGLAEVKDQQDPPNTAAAPTAEGLRERIWGNIQHDSAMLIFATGPLTTGSGDLAAVHAGAAQLEPLGFAATKDQAAQLAAEAEDLLLQLQKLPPGAQLVQAPQRQDFASAGQQVSVEYRFANGLQLRQRYQLTAGLWRRFEVLTWPDLWDGDSLMQAFGAPSSQPQRDL